jgi:rubredoxin
MGICGYDYGYTKGQDQNANAANTSLEFTVVYVFPVCVIVRDQLFLSPYF